MPQHALFNGIVGRMPRAQFDATYEPCAPTHRQADVLMEPCEDDPTLVMLYPAYSSVAVYPWQSFWREKRPAAGGCTDA